MHRVRFCTFAAVFFAAIEILMTGNIARAMERPYLQAPPEPGDIVLRGEIALAFHDGFIFAKIAIANGDEGWVVLDLASKHSVIRKDLLPGDATITPQKEQTGAPIGREAGMALGAFGIAPEILGRARVHSMNLGGLGMENVDVAVVGKLPDAGGRHIAGIVGFDILRRAEVLDLDMRSSTPVLRMRSAGRTVEAGMTEVPMRIREDAVFLEGQLNGKTVEFLLDTGAPESFVSLSALRLASLVAQPESRHKVVCMDGKTAMVSSTRAKSVLLGGREFGTMRFSIAELPAFCRFKSNETPALLGSDFLEQAGRLEIDFTKGIARIPKE